MPKTRKLALMAMFTAASLIVFVIEAQIPAPIPVPGIKLGLATVSYTHLTLPTILRV